MEQCQTVFDQLRNGEMIVLKLGGGSMIPIIKPYEPLTIVSCDPEAIEPGDVVYCKVKGRHFAHLVKAIQGKGEKKRFLIGNNHGGINGWIGINNLHGVVVKVGERVVKKLAPRG